MKSFFAIIVMAFVLPGYCFSQIGNRNTESVAIGIKGGVALPGMSYSDKYLSELEQDAFFAPVGGLFVSVPLGDIVSIAPEVMYANRGSRCTTRISQMQRFTIPSHRNMSIYAFPYKRGCRCPNCSSHTPLQVQRLAICLADKSTSAVPSPSLWMRPSTLARQTWHHIMLVRMRV